MKRTYRIYATESVRYYVDIEAESADEADEIAENTDSQEWREVPYSNIWESEKPEVHES